MADFKKRGERSWRARVRRKGHPTKTGTFDTKALAQEWACRIENEINEGSFRDLRRAQSMTLSDALNRYINDEGRRLAPTTQIRDRNRANSLRARAMAAKPLATITRSDIADFIREREKEGRKADTIRLELALIGRVFKVATTWHMEGLRNPVQEASDARPRASAGRTRRCSRNEQAALKGASSDIQACLIDFALETCMRRGEIAELDWRNVDLVRRVATVFRPKNKETRTVPLPPGAFVLLHHLRKGRKAGNVFGVTEDMISKGFAAAAKDAGIKDMRFHDLRHEGASRLFEDTDLDMMEIKEITGHKRVEMLSRYTHLRAERLVERLTHPRRRTGIQSATAVPTRFAVRRQSAQLGLLAK